MVRGYDKLRVNRAGEKLPPAMWMLDRARIDRRVKEARELGMSVLDYSKTALYRNRYGEIDRNITRSFSRGKPITLNLTKSEMELLENRAQMLDLTVPQLILAVLESKAGESKKIRKDNETLGVTGDCP